MDQPQVQDIAKKIIDNVEKVIVGKRWAVELAVTALLSQGHILITDIPGVGKTMLGKSLAQSIDCVFKRIQLTPDMLPSDITGVSVFNQQTGEFVFRPGPILGQIVLADEINRATPKTQSALLEALAERQVTVDGVTHSIARPFMLIATENPIEHGGVFALPEAQLDRFMLRIQLGYPSHEDEMSIIDRQRIQHPIEGLGVVAGADEVMGAREVIKSIFVERQVQRYIVLLVHATRKHDSVMLGASPRASLDRALMVSRFSYPSFKNLAGAERVSFGVLLLVPLTFGLIALNPPVVLLALFGGFALYAPVQWVWRRLRRRPRDPAGPPAA